MTRHEKIIFWLPRVLSIVFILFVSLFALDVFSSYSGLAVIVPLFMHLIPSFVLAVALAIAWTRDWFGAFVYLGFAVWYVLSAGVDRPWSWYLAIAAPAAIIGTFFLTGWLQKRRRA